MQTVLTLLIFFLIVIFSVLLYFKQKNSRLDKLQNGICPNCGAEPKTFKDPNTNTIFTDKPISSRLLKNHGCSGAIEIEYRCKQCELKEVHSENSGGCSI